MNIPAQGEAWTGHPRTPVPFDLVGLKNIFVSWTPDRRWRILSRLTQPSSIDVVSIEREEGS
jgi:hypothetical protein